MSLFRPPSVAMGARIHRPGVDRSGTTAHGRTVAHMFPDMREDYIGLRVAQLRDVARLTQQQLADRVGVARPYISQIENGHRAVTTRRLLHSLAAGLGVEVGMLTAQPVTGRSSEERALHAIVPAVRAALDGVAPAPDIAAEQLPGLSAEAMHARMHCDYPRLTAVLPTALAAAIGMAESGHTAMARHASALCTTASLALRPLGYVDLAVRLAERAKYLARECDDVEAGAAASYAIAQAAMVAGGPEHMQRAAAISDRLAAALEGMGGDGILAWRGFHHLNAALATASAGNLDDALARVDEAAALAGRVTGNPWEMDFGSANVEVWRVAVLYEGGEFGRAADVGRRVDRSGLRTRQRVAHLLTHTGRAHFMAGDAVQAARTLLEADRVAPSEVRFRSSVREATGQMIRDERRRAGSDELRELAVRVGVDPLNPGQPS